MTESELMQYIHSIPDVDHNIMESARKRQSQLAKPPGSLGKLEDISIRLSGITGTIFPAIDNCRVLVFAADNGVVSEGVSCTPQSVTRQQCINMTRHKTGMSALAQAFGNSIVVTDVGVSGDVPAPVVNRKIRHSTGNIAREPAMSRQQAIDAMAIGIDTVLSAKKDGIQAVGIGEMGIGNTTTSAAVLCALTGAAPEHVTGRGGGLTDTAFQKKKQVVTQALSLHQPNGADLIDIICKVGGLDIAAMAGAYLGCAMLGMPAVVDGYISIVAALCASHLCDKVRNVLFLSHDSYEIGYRIAADVLQLSPCLLLDMRLGEGSGCVLMFQVLKAACAVMKNMATFDEAAINDEYLDEIRQIDAYTVE